MAQIVQVGLAVGIAAGAVDQHLLRPPLHVQGVGQGQRILHRHQPQLQHAGEGGQLVDAARAHRIGGDDAHRPALQGGAGAQLSHRQRLARTRRAHQHQRLGKAPLGQGLEGEDGFQGRGQQGLGVLGVEIGDAVHQPLVQVGRQAVTEQDVRHLVGGVGGQRVVVAVIDGGHARNGDGLLHRRRHPDADALFLARGDDDGVIPQHLPDKAHRLTHGWGMKGLQPHDCPALGAISTPPPHRGPPPRDPATGTAAAAPAAHGI
ncbi:hypothetical protein AZA_87464 [Nitrospirillum viridazoti Y2]|nr:hypothetical protein AZA_87464 [Nitrospirillum amazonense Y2]